MTEPEKTKKEAAEFAGVSESTITRWILSGVLPYTRRGVRKVMIKTKDLAELCSRNFTAEEAAKVVGYMDKYRKPQKAEKL